MCWAPVASRAGSCPACGSDLQSPEALRLAELDLRIAELTSEREELVALVRQAALPPPPPAFTPPPTPGHAPLPPPPARAKTEEWRPASLGILLLWVGVALLALAGLIFAVVAWPDLGNGARALILVVATAATGGVSVALHRRLPVTSESLAVLFIALLLVDWQALWQAGVGNNLDGQLWWSTGLAVTGLVAVMIGAAADQKVPRVSAGILFPVSGLVLVTWVAHTPLAAGVGLAIVVSVAVMAAVLVSRVEGWGGLVAALVTVGMMLWFLAVAMTIGGTSTESLAEATGSAAAVVLLGVPLGCLRAGLDKVRADRSLDALLGAVMALLGVWAIGDVLAVGLTGNGLFVAASLMGLVILVGSRTLRGRITAGWAPAGTMTLAAVAAPAAAMALFAFSRVVDGVIPAWRGSLESSVTDLVIPLRESGGSDLPASDVRAAVAVVAVLAVATALEALDLGDRAHRLKSGVAAVFGCTLAAGALVLVPFAFGFTVVATLSMLAVVAVTSSAGAVLVGRDADDGTKQHFATAALVVAGGAWALGVLWSLVDRWATVVAIGVGIVLASGVAVLRRTPSARTAFSAVATVFALVEAGVVPAALRAEPAVVGFAIAATGGAVVLAWAALAQPRAVREPSEVLAIIGMAIGTLVAWAADTSWGAGALTLAVPVLAVASLRDERVGYRWAAVVLAVVAWWAWLGAFDVEVLEIYTLPAAAVALVAGWTQRRTETGSHSWLAYGPGLVLGLFPTLALVLSGEQATRAVVLAVGAIVVTGVGVARRLQAPVVLGVTTLLVLAVDTLWPVAAQVPRWALIGAAGALFVWIGATFEHRWRDLRRAGGALGRLH